MLNKIMYILQNYSYYFILFYLIISFYLLFFLHYSFSFLFN